MSSAKFYEALDEYSRARSSLGTAESKVRETHAALAMARGDVVDARAKARIAHAWLIKKRDELRVAADAYLGDVPPALADDEPKALGAEPPP